MMSTPRLSCIIIALLTANAIAESTYTSVVETSNGPVRGEILSTVRKSLEYGSFKGIPFAEPPVGYLRFKPPVEKTNWTDVLNATKEGNVCPQYVSENNTLIGDEDCLFINVFTPHINFTNIGKNDLKAVMVWIYGGSFITGYSNSAFYGPDFLLEDDVILVSFNYRLGALGFLNVEHENATGNAGLKDQSLALRWVQKNIAKFGGDPKKVTIFGQSAGSVSVDLQVLSEMSQGLFNNSISMSGSPLCLYWGIQSSSEAILRAFALGAALGKVTLDKNELFKTLYNASAFDIVNKTQQDLPLLPFRPTIERVTPAGNPEKFLSKCTLNYYYKGNYHKGPHMLGFTSLETLGIEKTELLLRAKAILTSLKNASLNIDIPVLKEVDELSVDGLSKLSKALLTEFIRVTSNLLFVTGIDTKQRLLNLHNGHPIYYYRSAYSERSLEFYGNDTFRISGVGHAEDLTLLFYNAKLETLNEEPDNTLMINRYVRLWTNFAKYGNPTPSSNDTLLNDIKWPSSGLLGLHLDLNITLTVGPRPIDPDVMVYEIAGLGDSPILNDCV